MPCSTTPAAAATERTVEPHHEAQREHRAALGHVAPRGVRSRCGDRGGTARHGRPPARPSRRPAPGACRFGVRGGQASGPLPVAHDGRSLQRELGQQARVGAREPAGCRAACRSATRRRWGTTRASAASRSAGPRGTGARRTRDRGSCGRRCAWNSPRARRRPAASRESRRAGLPRRTNRRPPTPDRAKAAVPRASPSARRRRTPAGRGSPPTGSRAPDATKRGMSSVSCCPSASSSIECV